MYQLKEVLNELVENAYPDDEKLGAYKAFCIEVLNKDYKGRHGDYNPSTRHIRLMNTYRDEKRLTVTSIHELAHHVNHMQGNTDIHGKGFWANFTILLHTALDMKLFSKDEYIAVVCDKRDSQGDQKVIRAIKDYIPKDVGYKSDKIKAVVFGGYDIKDTLKDKGFLYNKISKAWELELSRDVEDGVKKWLDTLNVRYEISEASTFLVKDKEKNEEETHREEKRKSVRLSVYNSFAYKEQLKELGYSYNSKTSSWDKYIIPYHYNEEVEKLHTLDKDAEKKMIVDSTGQGIYIIYVYNSYNKKDDLRAIRFRYNPEKKAWVRKINVNDSTDYKMSVIINKLYKLGLTQFSTKSECQRTDLPCYYLKKNKNMKQEVVLF